jgi:hypothetical protein
MHRNSYTFLDVDEPIQNPWAIICIESEFQVQHAQFPYLDIEHEEQVPNDTTDAIVHRLSDRGF